MPFQFSKMQIYPSRINNKNSTTASLRSKILICRDHTSICREVFMGRVIISRGYAWSNQRKRPTRGGGEQSLLPVLRFWGPRGQRSRFLVLTKRIAVSGDGNVVKCPTGISRCTWDDMGATLVGGSENTWEHFFISWYRFSISRTSRKTQIRSRNR